MWGFAQVYQLSRRPSKLTRLKFAKCSCLLIRKIWVHREQVFVAKTNIFLITGAIIRHIINTGFLWTFLLRIIMLPFLLSLYVTTKTSERRLKTVIRGDAIMLECKMAEGQNGLARLEWTETDVKNGNEKWLQERVQADTGTGNERGAMVKETGRESAFGAFLQRQKINS